MTTTFHSPSYRASASDLTISVSPLGLVELGNEEFEVHGPRLNRYAANWAFYLGHQFAFRRELGENNLVFNYVKAFADYLVNFTFGKGVTFGSPEATAGVVPYVLKRAWETDNDKMSTLWEIGQHGAISGDVFVKVAYEEPYVDGVGRPHPGRFRILPINPAFAFPEFHPHDKNRLSRFKQKYKIWTTGLDGTRQLMTYTEILTDEWIEEYLNDELLDRRPNPIGTIPVAYVPNRIVASSPWGLSDISDLVPLNREFNEKAQEISDIINYYSAPVTVIIGAKPNNLEKGARKLWTIGSKDARVETLTMQDNFSGILGYMELLKQTMHELTGVPAHALGTTQPISNTSSTALEMLYLPMMLQHGLKVTQYSKLFRRVNELVMLYAVVKEPQALVYNPYVAAIPLKPGQYPQLDPSDPITYMSTVHWPSPLPTDVLVKINEIQAKLAIGIESKKGAIHLLGDSFPEQKLYEIQDELVEDAKADAAVNLIRTQAQAFISQATGMNPDGTPMLMAGPDGQPAPVPPQVDPVVAQDILVRAYEPAPAQRESFDSQ